MEFCSFDSPVGRLTLFAEGDFLTGVSYTPQGELRNVAENRVLIAAERQLSEYFRGERKVFDLPLRYEATVWQRNVWGALRRIPFGETLTYGEVAVRCGCPGGAQAVGGACHRNPLLIVVPCHRVVASGGLLGGFGAGVEMKQWLLDFEGKKIRTNF